MELITDCPNCKRQISSRATLCNHCGFELGEVSEAQLTEFRRRKLRDRIYHLKMYSYTAIAVLLAAIGWYWWESGDFSRAPTTVPTLLVIVGAAGYVIVRGWLIMARRELRKLR